MEWRRKYDDGSGLGTKKHCNSVLGKRLDYYTSACISISSFGIDSEPSPTTIHVFVAHYRVMILQYQAKMDLPFLTATDYDRSKLHEYSDAQLRSPRHARHPPHLHSAAAARAHQHRLSLPRTPADTYRPLRRGGRVPAAPLCAAARTQGRAPHGQLAPLPRLLPSRRRAHQGNRGPARAIRHRDAARELELSLVPRRTGVPASMGSIAGGWALQSI